MVNAAQATVLAASDTPADWNTVVLLSIPLLAALNGLLVAAEFALAAVRKARVGELVRWGRQGGPAAEEATSDLDRSIAATRLGIGLAGLSLGWVVEPVLARLLGPLFGFLPNTWGAVATHSIAVGLALLLVTILHVTVAALRSCGPATHRFVWRVFLPPPHYPAEARREPTPAGAAGVGSGLHGPTGASSEGAD